MLLNNFVVKQLLSFVSKRILWWRLCQQYDVLKGQLRRTALITNVQGPVFFVSLDDEWALGLCDARPAAAPAAASVSWINWCFNFPGALAYTTPDVNDDKLDSYSTLVIIEHPSNATVVEMDPVTLNCKAAIVHNDGKNDIGIKSR